MRFSSRCPFCFFSSDWLVYPEAERLTKLISGNLNSIAEVQKRDECVQNLVSVGSVYGMWRFYAEIYQSSEVS